jgi:hypothetical protein
MANPLYVANNIQTVPPAEPILGTDDLQIYTPIDGLGALAQAAGITSYGGDHYYNGTTIISTNYISPATIAAWDGSWAMPVNLNDGTTFIGGAGQNRQPQTGSQAIDFDGTTYAIGALDLNGNPAVFTSTSPKTAWSFNNPGGASGTFNAVQALKWIPRLHLWIAVGDAIWTSPAGAATWTSRDSSDTFYPQIYEDDTTVWVIGTTKVFKTTNGTSWTGTVFGANFPKFTSAHSPLFYSSTAGVWVGIANQGGSSPDPHNGIVWANTPDGAWTYGYTSPNDPPSVPADDFLTIGQVGSTIYVAGTRLLSIGPTTKEAVLARGTDGKTWTFVAATLPEVPVTAESEIDALIGAPDNASLGIALDNGTAANRLTNAYSTDQGTTLVNEWLGGKFNQIISALPPPPPNCVDFEIQSPGDMPDSGAQFTGQRLYITANLNVSGVPQVITPTLIVDGAEIVLPQITNTERGTIELPISKYHGRFFDGVRLDGCLTGRIEIFRIEADVWLGEQSESS